MEDDYEPNLDGKKYRKVKLQDIEPGLTFANGSVMDNPPTFLFQRKPPAHKELLNSDNLENRLLGQFLEALSLGASDHVDQEDRMELMKLVLLLGYVTLVSVIPGCYPRTEHMTACAMHADVNKTPLSHMQQMSKLHRKRKHVSQKATLLPESCKGESAPFVHFLHKSSHRAPKENNNIDHERRRRKKQTCLFGRTQVANFCCR